MFLPQKIKSKFFAFASLSFAAFILIVLANPTPALAASAYISPATGLITNSSFKVSVYVESSSTEPQIASTHIKISYPADVNVVSIDNGDFDSYIQKDTNTTAREISINAVNNAGSYKTGKVKVASINFDTQLKTGQVQLTISSSSEINGAGGEQLLTETINGVYSLNISSGTTTPAVESIPAAATTEVTTTEVPATGGNNFVYYMIISTTLIALGIITFLKSPAKLQRS